MLQSIKEFFSALFFNPRRNDPTKNEPTPVFVVDVSKSPIPPPLEVYWGGEYMDVETDFSRRSGEAWNEYIKLYGEALKKKKLEEKFLQTEKYV